VKGSASLYTDQRWEYDVTSLMTFGFRLLNDLPEARRVMMMMVHAFYTF